MSPTDDIKDDTPPPPPETPGRSVGPESETRGGPEAPDETLDMPNGHPGERAALPPGSLPKPYLGPQSDENRDPPPQAPSATGPADTVPESTTR